MEECWAKLQKVFPNIFDAQTITSEREFNRRIYTTFKFSLKEEIKQLASDFIKNGTCHPFFSELLKKMKYAVHFDIWNIQPNQTRIHVRRDVHDDIKELIHIVSIYPQIKKLSISKVDDTDLELLGDYLATNPPITELYVGGSRITNKGVQALAQSLAFNSTLQNIDISAHHVDDEAAFAFAQYLPFNISLKGLRLSDTQISEIGAKALLHALSINTSLQFLALPPLYEYSNPTMSQIKRTLKENKILNHFKRAIRALDPLFVPSHHLLHNPTISPDERNTAANELGAARELSRRLQTYI